MHIISKGIDWVCYTYSMKHIQKSDAEKFENSKDCFGLNYPMGDPDINAAVIQIKGRYPEQGRTLNEQCKELAYVISGKGKVCVEDKEYQLHKEDMIFIDKGERYYFEGNMLLFVPCTPAWSPEQHKMVP